MGTPRRESGGGSVSGIACVPKARASTLISSLLERQGRFTRTISRYQLGDVEGGVFAARGAELLEV